VAFLRLVLLQKERDAAEHDTWFRRQVQAGWIQPIPAI
jgi:hypothetical protein